MSTKKGYTLIELIVVIVIIGIVSSIAIPFVVAAVDAWLIMRTEREVLSEGRYALERMTREIRQIKSIDDIGTFSATQFEFTDVNDNSIDFEQSGTTLLRNDDILLGNLQNPEGLTFTYLDSSSNETAVKANIRMVRIKLILESGDTIVRLRSLARFRNT